MINTGAQFYSNNSSHCRHHVEYLHELLTSCSIPTAMIFGKMDNTARKIELNRFKKKKCRFLIVTDIAARGIDIPQLDAVINYDFPTKPKLFVHRVGRTARAGTHPPRSPPNIM